MDDTIRVFVGGTSEHVLPTRVLEFSIQRRTSRPVEVSRLWDCDIAIPEVTNPANFPRTPFSFQRFLIPEICQFEGRGIYLDSDMVVLGDIGELWDTPFPAGHRVQVTPRQSAVMLVDNTVGWRIADLVAELNSGRRTYGQLMGLDGFGSYPSLSPLWNCTDKRPEGAKLLHYTNMKTQPWLRKGHPLGDVWDSELLAALQAGAITADDVIEAVELQHVRPSLVRLIGLEPVHDDSQFVPVNNRRDRSRIVQPRGETPMRDEQPPEAA